MDDFKSFINLLLILLCPQLVFGARSSIFCSISNCVVGFSTILFSVQGMLAK